MPAVLPRGASPASPPIVINDGKTLPFQRVATLPLSTVRDTLVRRQDIGIIPPSYQRNDNTLAPAAVAGIVLAAVVGTLLIVWLIWWATWGQTGVYYNDDRDIVVDRRDRSPHRRRSRRSSHHGPEVIEIRRSRSFSPRRRSAQIVEERIVEERIPIPRSRPHSRPPSIVRETVVLEDRRPRRHSRGEDVIIVDDTSSFSSEPRRHRRRRSDYRY